jgi:hypothetical protein
MKHFLLYIALCTSAFATQTYTNSEYYIRVHYNDKDQKLEKVVAHVGVAIQNMTTKDIIWNLNSIDDIKMWKSGDSFVGLYISKTDTYNTSYQDRLIGPKITLHLFYKDGTDKWVEENGKTKEFDIPVVAEHRFDSTCEGPARDCVKAEIVKKIHEDFRKETGVESTFATALHYYRIEQ